MQIAGKVIEICAQQTGQNKAGTAWRKQEVILEKEFVAIIAGEAPAGSQDKE